MLLQLAAKQARQRNDVAEAHALLARAKECAEKTRWIRRLLEGPQQADETRFGANVASAAPRGDLDL